MELMSLKCPNCGGNTQIDTEKDKCFCMYCGSELLVKDEAEDHQDEMTIKVETVNNEFESKLANADNWADAYFTRGPGAVRYGDVIGYQAVFKYYSLAELAGANESRIYLHSIRFYIRANLEGFKSGKRLLTNKEDFIYAVTHNYDLAIKYADDSEKPAIEKEKQDALNRLKNELANVKEERYTNQKNFLLYVLSFLIILSIIIIELSTR